MFIVPALLALWLFCCPIIVAAILLQWLQNKYGARVWNKRAFRRNGYFCAIVMAGYLIVMTFVIVKRANKVHDTPASQPDDSSPVADSAATQPTSQPITASQPLPGSENQGDSFNRIIVRHRSKGF